MKRIASILILTMGFLLLHSCNDDFMDRFPKTEIGRENFFNTREDLQIYINGLINWPGIDINLESSDDAYTTGFSEFRNVMTQNLTSQNFTGGWSWNRLRQINFFLENFTRVTDNLTEAELKHFEGVARLHRARFYMGMIRRFGPVPWYDKVLSTDDPDLFKPRDSREYVIDKVFEDLLFAAEHVFSDGRVGEVNKWVAKSYLVRYALYEGTFRKYHTDYLNLTDHNRFLQMAHDHAKDIMESGRFAIHNTGNPMTDYGSLFNNTNLANNTEIILLNRSIEGERNSGWWTGAFGAYEQSPSKDLVQAYLMDDGSFYSSQSGWETNSFVEEFENRDPRLFQTITYPGWVLHNPSSHAVGTAGEPYIQQFNPHFTGYHTLKWFVNNPSPQIQASIDIPVIRYAEILLSYAEAKAELGELTQSDLDISINHIRQRAGIPDLTMNPPVDPVQQARYPNITGGTSQWAELLEIRRERRVEMTHESTRFADLMRWRAGHLLEKGPEGLYFSGLGNFDLTGNGHADVKLIPHTETIPPFAEREQNELGVTLIYYRTGDITTDATVFLENATHGNIIVTQSMGTFQDPKHYYRPIPFRDTQINPNLTQMFGWE